MKGTGSGAMRYFEEILVLSRKKPVKTGGLQGSLF